MNKITKFRDIPQFTKSGSWQADFDFEMLLDFIDDQIETNNLQLNPDFQRGHIWTEDQQIKWLEFFLRGGKTGRVLYFNKPDWNISVPEGSYYDFVCVDVVQIITSIRLFVNNEIKVFGSYINEYEDKMSLVRNCIHVNINDLKSKKDVLQWYIDMNDGGTPHTTEEIARVKQLLNNL